MSSKPHRFYEVPPLGKPFALRGASQVAVLLDEFAPTHIDAWRGRAVVPATGLLGVPSDAPLLLDGDPQTLVVRAVVVRHAGDLTGRPALFGARRRHLDALLTAQPPDRPLAAVVIEEGAHTLFWVAGEPDDVARRLSRKDWRALET